MLDNFTLDKYELEASPLTQYLLERRQPHVAWQVFVRNSSKYSELGHPFGYLKASTNLNAVNLFVMPYNYPLLFSLLNELIEVLKFKITESWKIQFNGYLKSVPPYYATFLRKAFNAMLFPPNLNLIPDQMENCFSYEVVSKLDSVRNQAKTEYRSQMNPIGQRPQIAPMIEVLCQVPQTSLLNQPPYCDIIYKEFQIHTTTVIGNMYTNPFNIDRKDLISSLTKLRMNFLNPFSGRKVPQQIEVLHSMPIQEMGNYQEYLKKQTPPLRELETTPTRIHTFGNPFKVKKNLVIDDVMETVSNLEPPLSRKRAASPSPLPLAKKRRPGPLPKNVPWKNFLLSPPPTPPSSIEDSPVCLETSPSTTSDADESPEAFDSICSMDHIFEGTADSVLDDDIDFASLDDDDFILNISYEEPSTEDLYDENTEYNKDIRRHCLKEVRRTGRHYNNLLNLLKSLRGSIQSKKVVIDRVVLEASRFKRKIMIQAIQDMSLT